jgi:hypothetical protein
MGSKAVTLLRRIGWAEFPRKNLKFDWAKIWIHVIILVGRYTATFGRET